MKIALINNRFSSSHGGLERFACNLARTLIAGGHEVHLFAQSFADVPAGASTHLIKVVRKPAALRIWSFARKVRRAIEGEDFDVVYGLTRTVPLDIYRMGDGLQRHWLALRYPQTWLRWLNRLINPTHAVNLLLEKQVFNPKNCHMWVANSRLCQEQAIRYLSVAKERVRVVYNGVDHTLFNPQSARRKRTEIRRSYSIGEQDIAIVYVAHNWQRKGLAILLRAMAARRRESKRIHLLVIGRGKPAHFAPMVRDMGLIDRVHFIGPSRNIVDYYGAGDLFVLPTRYDPFSNVCLEAMACGLPVITTAENGAAELIEQGVSGFVQQDPGSEEELAGWLGLCLELGLLAKMGVAAEQATKDFTLERTLEETLAVFREVIREKGMTVDEHT